MQTYNSFNELAAAQTAASFNVGYNANTTNTPKILGTTVEGNNAKIFEEQLIGCQQALTTCIASLNNPACPADQQAARKHTAEKELAALRPNIPAGLACLEKLIASAKTEAIATGYAAQQQRVNALMTDIKQKMTEAGIARQSIQNGE